MVLVAVIGSNHACGLLDACDKLEQDVGGAERNNDGARDNAQDVVVEQQRANEDVKHATAHKRKEKRRVVVRVWWHAEFCRKLARGMGRGVGECVPSRTRPEPKMMT